MSLWYNIYIIGFLIEGRERIMNEIQVLESKIKEYDNAYFEKGESYISDAEYDSLVAELHRLKANNHIEYQETIGESLSGKFDKIQHIHPMKSLKKTKDVHEIMSFRNNHELVIMPKFDGISCSLTYKNGTLVSMATRGNGKIGEDITDRAPYIEGFPLELMNNEDLCVSGELVVLKNDFDKINLKLKNSNLKEFKLQRSLVAGTVRNDDPILCQRHCVRFFAYNLLSSSCNESKSKIEDLNYLFSNGFSYTTYTDMIYPNFDEKEIIEHIEDVKRISNDMGIPIDGVVFTYNDKSYSKLLGETEHHPNHSIAFKFLDEEHITQFRGVELTPTRTGMVSLVAVFDPVNINGSEITRASLHNIDVFESLELGIGDRINIIKSNDIIPKITDNLDRSNTYQINMICPCCGEKLMIEQPKNARYLYCSNENCSMKLVAKFSHFCSREGMNIEGLSDATLEKFVNMKILNQFSDIFDMDNWNKYKNDIVSIDGFGIKSFHNLMNSIEKSKKVLLSNFINALGIPLVGKKASEEISKKCKGKINNFISLLLEKYDWTKISDFGEKINSSIHDYFDNDSNFNEMMKLSYKLNFITSGVKSNILNNMNFVVTGNFEELSRDEIKEMIEENGGSFKTSVSKKTNYLICGNNAGSKLNKAKDLSIPVITLDEFKKFLK